MSAPMTPERLAEMPWDEWPEVEQLRYRLEKLHGAFAIARSGWLRWRDKAKEAEAEVDRLRAQVAAVESLTGGPFSDGYRPYAMNISGEVVLAVALDDLRAALEVQP